MYKVGDLVHIRSDLVPGKFYGGTKLSRYMNNFLGTDVRIRHVLEKDPWRRSKETYLVDGNTFVWSEEMFEHLSGSNEKILDGGIPVSFLLG